MERVDVDHAVPAELSAAISQGWRGLTMLADEEPLTLVVGGHAPTSVGGAGGSLTIGLHGEAAAEGRVLVFGLDLAPDRDGAAQDLRLGLDLAYAEAREVVLRLARGRSLRVVWLCAHAGRPPLVETVELGAPGAALLRRAAARAGEWHVGNPRPPALGGSPEAPEARLAAAEPPVDEVRLVAPADALRGLEECTSSLALASRLVDGAGAGAGAEAADLVFLLSSAVRPGLPARRVPIRLDCAEQRDLARRLAAQGQLVVLGVCPHGALRRCLRAILTPAGRALIARAADCAEAGAGP